MKQWILLWKKKSQQWQGFSASACLWLVLESGLLGLIRQARLGHRRSAALCVKYMVGKPRVSTIEISRLRCLYQYALVVLYLLNSASGMHCKVIVLVTKLPHRLQAKCWTRLQNASLLWPIMSRSSATERWASCGRMVKLGVVSIISKLLPRIHWQSLSTCHQDG